MSDLIDQRDEEKLLECGICLSRLNDPRKLDCRHAFCFICIKNHYKACGKRMAPCPICRKLYPSLDAKVEQLPQCSINFHQLLDTRNSKHSCESELCGTIDAPFLCLKCKKWLCFRCKEQSNEISSCQNHEAYRISDIDARLYNIVVQSKHKSCVDHPGYDIQWFCRQCHMLGCNYCKTRQPLDHTLIDVDKRATELREQFSDVCLLLQTKSGEHEIALNFFHEIREKFSPLGVCNTSFCETSANEHKKDVIECKSLIHIMKYLTNYASDEVVVSIYLNMEDQIASELEKHPLEEVVNIPHWLADSSKAMMSTEGRTSILNKREIPKNDTDISKKINLAFYFNLMAIVLLVTIVLVFIACVGSVIYYRSDVWQGIQHRLSVSAIEFIHTKLEGMLQEAFKPELISQYRNITEEFVARYDKFQNDSLGKWLDFVKMTKDEYCHKSKTKTYSNYGGDFRFQYKLDISTFCK
ncbi:tripartite motif-containing protein 59-like [Pecten maximus]|uniref:tripartite motif-containing protein 59-like n=1 Tax=Pecten maximus TaxID=6579 RepID=UPI001458A8B1|nr:tripartite motif-containing protein 59-like [Pecten maximus]XP_033725480.1 tripartite motif-containing protein 59-like [Pecten maximus]